jgi:O-acetyl-ADP-ribose deacetylase (regulator of RNase III)
VRLQERKEGGLMSVTRVSGNIFADTAEAIVNPVNCVGTMGKGLAKRMAQRWPHAVPLYEAACAARHVRLGQVFCIDLWALKWEPFFWDSNDRWGLASTPDDWAKIRSDLQSGFGEWTEEGIRAARSRPAQARGDVPIGFGARSEHREAPTLGEFLDERGLTNPRWMICFPTKDHWRNPSRLTSILNGLTSLASACKGREIRSVAVPALGCGLGGLDWLEVRQDIEAWAKGERLDVRLYEPTEAP